MCDNMNNQKKLIGAIFTVMVMVFAGVVLTPDVSSAETDDEINAGYAGVL